MIVDMKKATVLCLRNDQKSALEKMRELGVMHVEAGQAKESEERSEYEQLLSKVERVIGVLSARKVKVPSDKFNTINGEDVCGLAGEALENENVLKKQLDSLNRDYERLAPWGEFSHRLLDELREKNVQVYLCMGTVDDIENLPPNVVYKVFSEGKDKFYFAVISDTALDESKLPTISIPKSDLQHVEFRIRDCREKIKENNEKLDDLSCGMPKLQEFQAEVKEKVEFYQNRDGMEENGEVVYISGYVPVTELESLSAAAKNNGWAYLLLDPTAEDDVPTLIKTPKIFEISRPIFNFIGISPGYREWDITTCFLFFFTIFFGMIVGDAGYGAIFLTAAIVAKLVVRDEKMQLTINLFAVLSIATIIWGALSGNYFGIPTTSLPAWMQGIGKPLTILPSWVKGVAKYKSLPIDEIRNKNVQYLCFLIAAIHLSLARFWKTTLYFKSYISALQQTGWGLLVWGNFFLSIDLIVFNGSFPSWAPYLYIVGLIMIIPNYAVNWRDVGNLLNFPFALIGSFVDVLSYIRLFAVGMSTFYIAKSFNDMSLMVLGASESKIALPFLIIGMLFIILFGHILNIALALIAVLVHGIRLNTLEFSNHMEIQWLGNVYKPFKKLLK